MPSPSSCVRCSKPFAAPALLSPKGLCQDCAATDVTADATPVVIPPVADSFAPTASHLPPARMSADATRTGVPASATADAPVSLRGVLPESPPGYELLDRLGGGGMGDVYLAREQPSERLVAIKFLRHPGHTEIYRRFVTELQVLVRLEHEHVVRVYSSNFLRPTPFFSMEYLEGGSLAEVIRRAGVLPLPDAVRVIRGVAAGVAALHAENVIHRDLKPGNILLTSDGKPKVADLGLAKLLDATTGATRGTGGLGTASYMPPEQVSSKNGEVGKPSDLYGLGATLYHLLTGQAPFTGDSPEEIIPQVLADPPIRPRALRADIPMALEGIVLKCLAKDPKDRYQSVAEFLADLDKYEAGQKPVAPPLTRARRAKQWVTRNPSVVAMTAVLLLGLVGLAAALWPKPDPQDRIRAEVKVGRKVEIVPVAGSPPWLKDNWLIHPAPIGTSATAGGACSFESLQPSLLAFLKDPGVDSYRITVELLIMKSVLADPDRAPGLAGFARSGVGLFLGHVSARGVDGTEAHGFLVVDFADYLPAAILDAGVTEAAIQPGGRLIVAKPDTPLATPYWGWYPTTWFAPAPTLPGEWRMIQIEVRPSGVKFFWAETIGQPLKLLAEASVESIARNYAELQDWLSAYRPDAAIVLPPWQPRAPFGIWSNSSAVAVRKVTIESLR